MRRLSLLAVLAIALGLGGVLVHDRPGDERLAEAAAQLKAQVDRATARLGRQAHAALEADTLDMGAAHGQGEGGMRLYRGHVVDSWTDHAPITDAGLDTAIGAHLVLADGIYLHALAEGKGSSVHAVQRIWFQPPFENQYLHRHFDKGFAVAGGVEAVTGAGTGPVVRDAAGQEMLRLRWLDDEAPPGTRTLAGILLRFAASVVAVALLWALARRIAGPWLSTLAFTAVLIGARLAFLALGGTRPLASYTLFDPSLFASSLYMPSLGDLLINAVLLLCLVLFARERLRGAHTGKGRWWPAFTALLVLFAMAAGITTVMEALVHDSSVSLDLFHVQGFNAYSLLALLSIGILLLGWAVLADTLVGLYGGGVSGMRSLALVLAASVVSIAANHVAGNYDLVPSLWPVPALWLIHRIHGRPATLPTLGLIAVMALITAHVLNRQTLKRMETDRRTIAEGATTSEDPVIEVLFEEARMEMHRSAALRQWAGSAAACGATDLDRSVRQPFFSGYWDRYDLRLHLVGTDPPTYCTTSADPASSAQTITDRFEQGVPAGSDHDLRITGRPGEDALYLGRMELGGKMLYIELRPRLVADGLGFPELLLAGQRPQLLQHNRYVQARYVRGVLASASGPLVFPLAWKKAVPAGGLQWREGGFDLLAEGDPQGSLVVLGTPVPTPWDHVTTFSYLFLFYCLLAIVVAGIHAVRAGRMHAIGVSGKVRIGVAGFALTGLVLFAFGMLQMIDVRQQQRSTRVLDERARGVIAELRQTLRWEDALPPSMAPSLDHLLANLSNVFFTDLTLYAPDGLVFATSREQVFSSGLLGRRMDPRAYHRLAIEGASSYIGREHIGKAGFSTAYLPFRNEQGRVLAYLALPYFARQAEVEQARASGYVALVNLFTLLFLLSVVAAALIAHWTTRPLQVLRQGLERIELGARNEPIPYRGNDELGQLVQVYNRKVEELRESALKLARSERESAWREMAKQVAHEIKNPLTPMKLNIQQFQRTWDPQAPDAQERLDRFSNGLVEQIDVLGRIAGEFSHFAQIPPARPQRVDLVEVARAAVQLFADTPDCTVTLHAEGPLPVMADREHLLRVFNNLVKNALQAIPDGTDGCVDVLLRQEGEEVVAEVRDNGSGIAPEDRGRIFQPSFTTKGSGMGLGLAMVKRMVENAGGRVWFTTGEGRGTSFFVALPPSHATRD